MKRQSLSARPAKVVQNIIHLQKIIVIMAFAPNTMSMEIRMKPASSGRVGGTLIVAQRNLGATKNCSNNG